ncbi:hypothetical protein AAG906_033240 [Vitis piasezkii]
MVEVNKLKSLLSKEFNMKDLGEAKKILGMEIHRIELRGDYGYLKIAMSREYWRDDEVKDMLKIPYESECGEQVSIKLGKNALGCNQSDPLVRGYVNVDYVGDLDDRRIYGNSEAAKESLWLLGGYLARSWNCFFDELLLEKVHTSENAVDMLTKPVTTEKFKHCLNLINVFNC